MARHLRGCWADTSIKNASVVRTVLRGDIATGERTFTKAGIDDYVDAGCVDVYGARQAGCSDVYAKPFNGG